MGKRQGNWKRWFLKYFDVNQNDEVDTWEILIPLTLIIGIELFVEFIAYLIF